MEAVYKGHLHVVQLLVEKGAALDMADEVRAGKDIYMLCNMKADDVGLVQKGYTALMKAAQFGHLPIVQYLVEQGAAMDVANEVRAVEDMCIYC